MNVLGEVVHGGHCFRKAQSISQGLCTRCHGHGGTCIWTTQGTQVPHADWGPYKCPELLGGKSYTAVWKVVVAQPCPSLYPSYPSQGFRWLLVSGELGQLPPCHKSPFGPFSRPWAKGVEVDSLTNIANQDFSLFLSGELAAEHVLGPQGFLWRRATSLSASSSLGSVLSIFTENRLHASPAHQFTARCILSNSFRKL